MDSDDYMYEEQKMNFEGNDGAEEQDLGQKGSTLMIPLSKFKMMNQKEHTGEESPSQGNFMKYRNKRERDFSPVTPSKA